VPRANFRCSTGKTKKIAKQGLISSRLPSPKPLILHAVGRKFRYAIKQRNLNAEQRIKFRCSEEHQGNIQPGTGTPGRASKETDSVG
jgi:hypothetical protein